MVNLVTRAEFVRFLSREGFECPTGKVNREFRKEYAPGIGIEVGLIDGAPIYELAAYIDCNQLFRSLRFPSILYVGEVYKAVNAVVSSDGQNYDLDGFKELCVEKQKDLSEELKIIRALNPHFDDL